MPEANRKILRLLIKAGLAGFILLYAYAVLSITSFFSFARQGLWADFAAYGPIVVMAAVAVAVVTLPRWPLWLLACVAAIGAVAVAAVTLFSPA